MSKDFYHALAIDTEHCIGCSHCVRECPTEAIRIRQGHAVMSANRCVDCNSCYMVCPTKAIYIKQDDFDTIQDYAHSVAMIPSVFLGQFPDNISVSRIYAALNELGFRHVFEVESTAALYDEAKQRYAEAHHDIRPLISAFCPAIVRLIQVKYPSLAGNLIPIRNPMALSAEYLIRRLTGMGVPRKEIGLFYVTPCAAMIAAVKEPVADNEPLFTGVINMDSLFNKVYRLIKEQGHNHPYQSLPTQQLCSDAILLSLTNGERRLCKEQRSYAIDGLKNVIDFLDRLEKGAVDNVDFLELRDCDQSCAGSILAADNRFLCAERLYARAQKARKRESSGMLAHDHEVEQDRDFLLSVAETAPIEARPLSALGDDISTALDKLEHINQLATKLPQIDCGLCGAPTCNAFATDVVSNNTSVENCVFVQRLREQQGQMTSAESIQRLIQIWGKDRLGNL